MSTTATHYTKLYPKQGNLTGSPDQAYNLLATKYFDHILGGIGAGTIAALGTVAPGSYNLSCIYAPQVHTNLSGNFLGYFGNASNKIGEFSCIHIHKDSFGLFQIINSKANLEEAMPSCIIAWDDMVQEMEGKKVYPKNRLYWGTPQVVYLKWMCTGTPIAVNKLNYT